MDRFAESLVKMMDKGQNIFDIARMFGGINELLTLTKKYPYLNALVMSKLGGTLYCSAADEDEIMIPFELPFIMTDLEAIDVDDFNHYNATVDIIIPEIQKSPALMQMLLTWLDDYLSDMGAEVGSFNDVKLNDKMIWVYAESINGKSFENIRSGVSDEEVLEIIPEEYKNP
jgi:hypothetical protein